MARPLRIEYDGALYHVIARGNMRNPIFRTERDRLAFLDKLAESVRAYHLRLHAFVLMTNHYHLLLETPRGNISQAMHQFQSSYSTYFRARHSLVGHVYAGRFKSPLVESHQYMLALSRYIHLNPVSIKSVKNLPLKERRRKLRQFKWSSYPGYIGRCKPLDWMSYDLLRDVVVAPRKKRKASYRAYVELGLAKDDEQLKEAMSRSSKALGGERFQQWVEDRYAELTEKQGRREDVAGKKAEAVIDSSTVLQAVVDLFGYDKDTLLSRGNTLAKDVLMLGWKDFSGLSNREIGHRLGHSDGATAGKRMKTISGSSQDQKAVQQAVKQLKKRLHS